MFALILPILLYIFLLVPYLYLIPSNDGSLEFLQSKQWLLGHNYITLMLDHPPLKLILFSFIFKLFGYHTYGYIGLLFGIFGIIAIYYIAKKLFDEKVAFLSAFLMSTSGLFISVGLFSIRDFIMTVFILIAAAFYFYSRYVFYAIFICLAVLTKETAIFFAGSILLSNIFVEKKVKFASITPLIILGCYIASIHLFGYHLWNDWNFSTTAREGSAITMINNLITLQLFNKYAYENWLHLFIFNFNWIYWIFVIISFFYIKKSEMQKKLFPIGLFALSFILMVLSFQTFTINRYILPLLPFVYIFASWGALQLRFKPIFVSLLIVTSLMSLLFSVDPISNMIWRKTQVLNEKVYLNKPIDGNDGITYNMQYLTIMEERTAMIDAGDCKIPSIISYNTQTLSLLKIHTCK